MTTDAVIYLPRMVGQSNQAQVGFFYPTSIKKQVAKPLPGQIDRGPEIDGDYVTFRKGVTFIDRRIWTAIEEHAPNQVILAPLKKRNGLLYYPASVEETVGSTADWEDPSEVADIVQNCSDRDWLQRSMAHDRREFVFKVISGQLKEIDEMSRNRADQEMSLSNW